MKGLTSAQKIEPLKPAHSDPGGLSKKRGLSTEMLPPVKRTSSTGNPGPSGVCLTRACWLLLFGHSVGLFFFYLAT